LGVFQSQRDSTVVVLLGGVWRSFSGMMAVLRFLRSAKSCSLRWRGLSSACRHTEYNILSHSELYCFFYIQCWNCKTTCISTVWKTVLWYL